MPARPEHDRHIVFLHAVLRLSDIVDLGNHEVQVMNDPLRTLAHSDAVMERTGERPHEGHDFPNAVGFPEVQHVAKESDRFRFLRHGPYDMAETLDFGVGDRERLARTPDLGREELQSGAGMWLQSTRHPPSLAEIALRGAKLFVRHIGVAKLAMKRLKLRAILQHPADALESCRLLLVQYDGAGILVVAPKHHRPVRSFANKLETDDVLIELARFLEVADVQLNVSKFVVADHLRFLSYRYRQCFVTLRDKPVLGTCFANSARYAPAGNSEDKVEKPLSALLFDRIPKHADRRDFDLADVARLHVHGRLARGTDTARRPHDQNVAGIERHAFGDQIDRLRNAKDHILGVCVLHDLSVQARLNLQ